MATPPQNAKSDAPKGGANGADNEAGKPKKSKKKLIFVAVLLLVLAGGGGGGWWYFMGAEKNESAKVEKPVAPIFLPLEQFTVNLQPESGEHYLQVGITLQVSKKEDVEHIKLYMPQIRSRILFLLTSKKGSEIATLDGKKKLTEEVKAQVNMPLTPGAKPQEVVNVFFTSFVIQ